MPYNADYTFTKIYRGNNFLCTTIFHENKKATRSLSLLWINTLVNYLKTHTFRPLRNKKCVLSYNEGSWNPTPTTPALSKRTVTCSGFIQLHDVQPLGTWSSVASQLLRKIPTLGSSKAIPSTLEIAKSSHRRCEIMMVDNDDSRDGGTHYQRLLRCESVDISIFTSWSCGNRWRKFMEFGIFM